jgi:hypothetical protein
MCDNQYPSNRQEFLRSLLQPRLYRDRADQLLKTMDDPRCACAPTCPLHRIPGEQWDRAEDVIRVPEPLAPASDG